MPIPCPRCIGGQMFLDSKSGIAECLQCGYTREFIVPGKRRYYPDDGLQSNYLMQVAFSQNSSRQIKPQLISDLNIPTGG